MDDFGRQINLDTGEGQIVNGEWTDDIRAVGSELTIEFISPRKLQFNDTADTYITYKTVDWVPISFSQIQSGDNAWTYSMHCFPRQVHIPIYKPCTNTAALASAMGLVLSAGSEILNIDYPIINIYSNFLIQEIKRQSMNKAAKDGDLGNAYFIYTNGAELFSVTWKSIIHGVADDLYTVIPELLGTDIVKYVQDSIATDACAVQHPEPFKYNGFLYRMIGQKFDFISTQPLLFGNMYTVKFGDTSDLDQTDKFMCIRSSFNFTKANGYTNTIAHIDLEV